MLVSGNDALPDGVLRFLKVNDDMIAMRRIFHRGIAIGVRGLSLRVDPRTGAVEAIRLMGRAPVVDPDAVESDVDPLKQRPWWKFWGSNPESTPAEGEKAES